MVTALRFADIKGNSSILDAGLGTGRALAEIVKKAGNRVRIIGLDISPKMVWKARELVEHERISDEVNLIVGDVAKTPFRDRIFDVVFCSYVLDLIDTPTIPSVLSEFKRTLVNSGRLILVSLSNGTKWYDKMRMYEWVYRLSPAILGGCRPIRSSAYLENVGFKRVKRHFMHAGHLMPTEIVTATKSDPEGTKA